LAKTLVSKNTIVVTVEYRLAFLGFLCLDDKLAKGNYGVWDVIEALKFIKLNAESFGGDSNRITVVGQSAGSCLADLLSLSPVSRDLFQQKFLMAGFAENSWAISNKRLVIEFCRNKAIELGFRRTNNSK
jgi:carboxylesterase type B